MNDKVAYVENILHFVFEEEISETIKQFPDPDSEIDSWYKIAKVYDFVTSSNHISDNGKSDLFDLVEDACTEIVSSRILNEEPDVNIPLGEGYDLPKQFVSKWQPIIWDAVYQIY